MTEPAGRLGPYQLLQPLGEGGMGVVWRAVHEPTGRLVALKTVRLLHARQLDGLRREIRALSRIRHPGVVRILDEGVADGVPWYAMELLEGSNLRQRARSLTATATTRFLLDSGDAAPTRQTTLDLDAPSDDRHPMVSEQPPEVRFPAANGKLDEVLALARALCEPLAFLHGEGIVHRDLKPENVQVLDSGRVVIVDFGLVSQGAAGRDTLTIDAMLHGTASYMSPEQIRGELVDARGDLYALGVILYELVTGRRPFVGASVGTTLFQALQLVPLAPSARVTGVPAALDALILGLLAKRREDRPGFATDVAEALDALGAARPTGPAPRPRPYLYRPRFSGRDDAMRQLTARLETRRGVVLVGGEPGAGKTRLALEFAHEAAARGRTVLVGECRGDAGGGAPLHPLRAALVAVADRCRQGARDTVESLLGDRGRLLARYEPSLATLPEVAASPDPEPLDPEAERLRTVRWLTLTLQAVGQPQGAVVLLDDLERADRLTLAWLAHVAASDVPGLLVVATHALTPGADTLDALRDLPGVERLTLRALDEAAVRALIGDLLAWTDVPDELVRYLVASCAGNPFLVAETLRAAVAAGAILRRGHRWDLAIAPDVGSTWRALDVPVRLEDLVRARLARLGPHATATAHAAAVLGRDVDLDRALQVAGLEAGGPEGLDALAELVQLGLVEATSGSWRFAHERVRDAIERDLGPADRVALHARAAALAESDPASDPGRIGRHWIAADRPDRAARWIGLAARRALDQAAPADAEGPLRAWLALDAIDPDERLEARILLGSRVFAALGRHAEAHEALEQARVEARDRDRPAALADATSALGDVAAATGRLADALALHEEVLALREALGDPGPRARARLRVAAGLAAAGRADETGPLVDAALDLAGRAGDPLLEGEALLAAASGRPEPEARARLLAAQARFEGAGARLHQARVLERLAGLESGAGARERYEQALDLYQRVGDRVRAGRVLTRLARVEHGEGRSGPSYDRSAEALAVFREAGHHRFQGHALLELGHHLRLDGRLTEAEGLVRQALTLLTVVGDAPWLTRAQLELARVALARGAADAALRHAGRAAAVARDLDQPAWSVEALHLTGLAHERLTDRAAARAAHGAAADLARSAGRGDLAARAEVWLARLDRLDGAAPDALDQRLDRALAALSAPEHHVARAVAWCERGLVALAAGQAPDLAWMYAQDAHHEPLRMDPIAAEHLAELHAARHRQ